MRIQDFKEVQELVELGSCLEKALVSANKLLTKYEESGGEYWCSLSEHKDGSGVRVDMTGCQVGLDMAKATVSVLEVNIKQTIAKLKQFSVTFEDTIND